MSKSQSTPATGGFITLFGSVLAFLAALVPFNTGIIFTPTLLDEIQFLTDLGKWVELFDKTPLDLWLRVALVALPLIMIILIGPKVVQKQFGKVRLLAFILSLVILALLVLVGLEYVQGSLAGTLPGAGPGLWLYLGGSVLMVLGSLGLL